MASTIINIVFGVALVVLFIFYYIFLYKKVQDYCESIGQLLEELQKFDKNEYAVKYQDICLLLEHNKYTESCWEEYSKTLVVSQKEFVMDIYSTDTASDYFTFARLTKNIDITFWQNLGGIFTGIGILGTFVGLTYGLYYANLDSNDLEALKTGIVTLLGGVSAAFLTSLFGVSFALVFNFIHKYAIDKAKNTTSELCSFVESMYPRKSNESWLMDIMNQSVSQTNALKNFSSDLVPALAKVFNQQIDSSFDKFIKSLEPLFQDLREGIEKMGEGGAKAVGETISNGIGNELTGFAQTLGEIQKSMAEGMKNTQEQAEATNKKFVELTENFADKITDSSSNAVIAQNKMMTDSIVKIEAIMKDLQVSSKEASDNFRDAINTSADKQRDSLNETCEQIRNVLTEVNSNIKKAAENMVEANSVANAALVKSIENMGSQGEKLAGTFVTHAETQAEILGNASGEFKKQLEIAVEKMQVMLDNHDKVMKQTYQQYEDGFNAALDVVNKTKVAAQEIGNSVTPIKSATISLTEQMTETVKITNDFSRVVGDKTEKLIAASTINEENLKKLISSLDKTKNEWQSYETHFRGVSGEMDKSFRNLISGTRQYNEAVSSGLEEVIRQYDSHIKEVLSKISAQVESVEEATDELNDYLYKVKRNR